MERHDFRIVSGDSLALNKCRELNENKFIAEQVINFITCCINDKSPEEIQKLIQPPHSFLGPKGIKT